MVVRAAVAGASGYAGGELLRLLLKHAQLGAHLLVLAVLGDRGDGHRQYRECKRRSNEVHVHAVSQHSTST